MKKIILASLVASALLAESTYNVKPLVGYVHTKDHVDIENHAVAGLAVSKNMNENSYFNELEVGLLQSGDADYVKSSKDTKITQFSFNGIKDYKLNDSFKFYGLAGFGFEYIFAKEFGNESDPFFNYGVGTAYTFTNDVALKLDVRHQLKFDGDKNIVSILGLSIPLGAKATKSTVIKEINIPVLPKDDDHDNVINKDDMCPNTPLGATVYANGCQVKVEDTKDDVVKPEIKEDKKIEDFKVSIIPVDLGIHFDTDSAKINNNEIVKFNKFVTYLNNVPEIKIILEAHTDSVGSAEYNLVLSNKRAASTKQQLISMGIDPSRISSIGYGETRPLVSNDTEENMEKNRRVTARIENK